MKKFHVIVCISVFIYSLISTPCFSEDVWTAYPSGEDENNYLSLIAENNIMWCGTPGGLIRWNTADSTHVKYTSADGLPERNTGHRTTHSIRRIRIDHDGIKWFAYGANAGATKFDEKDFTTYTLQDGIVGTKVYSIAVDSKNVKWFATDAGVGCFDGKEWSKFTIEDGLLENWVVNIAVDHNDVVWCGLRHGALMSFDGTIWKTHAPGDSITFNEIFDMAVDNNNILWFTYYRYSNNQYIGGIARYDGENLTLHPFDTTCAFCIAVDKDNVIWVTIGGPYVASFNGEQWTKFDINDYYQIHHHVSTITVDDNNIKWIGADRCLLRFDGEIAKPYITTTRFDFEDIGRIVVDNNNVKWFGSRNGFFRYDGTSWESYPNFEGKISQKFALAADMENNLWIGTDRGVWHFDVTDYTIFTTEDGLPNDRIYSIIIDTQNVKWFGTDVGISRYDGNTWENYTRENSIIEGYIYTVAVDRDNVIWCGGSRSNTYCFDGNEWSVYSLEGAYTIYSIAVDYDNIKWFGTQCGVWSYDGTVWTHYTTEDGLINDKIIAVAVDYNNKKWFGTNEGVSQFDGFTWTNYTPDNWEIMDHYNFSIAVDKNNVKWFGLQEGVVSFNDGPGIYNDQTFFEQTTEFPTSLTLVSTYPNPFNSSTTISFTLPATGFTQLVIYNITGQKVRELISETMTAGIHNIRWDGRDNSSAELSSGVYMSLIETNGFRVAGKMILMK